ncbi:MAG: restriction endonuclease [Methanobacteriota archaeon]
MTELSNRIDVDSAEFRSFIESYILSMDFVVKSVREISDGSVIVQAVTTNPMGGEILSIVRATPFKKEVDMRLVKELEREMESHGAVRGAFITTSDFTGEALDYVRGKPISLINRFNIVESLDGRGVKLSDSMLNFMTRIGLTEKRFLGDDHIFIPGKKRGEVLAYFESKRRKKRTWSRASPEKMEEVETRYAPVAMFKVTVSRDVYVESKSLGKTEQDDFLFVNLNNGDLYYLIRKRKVGATTYSVESSPVLREIIELPEDAKSELVGLLEHGEIPYKHLDGKVATILESKEVIKKSERGGFFIHYSTLKNIMAIAVYAIEEVVDLIPMFAHSILGTEPGDINRSLHQSEDVDEDKESVASATINMPHLFGGIYDLKKFLVIKMISGLKFKVDKIKYHSSAIASLLESIFSAVSVSSRGVLFLPYFVGTFRSTDVRGIRRREALIAPKFIIDEVKERKERRMPQERGPEGLKFDHLPYKIIR